MDKIITQTELNINLPAPAPVPAAKSNSKITKQTRVVSDMEDVFRAFDSMDEEGPVEFLVQNAPHALPPLPTDVEVQQQLLKNALLLVDGGEFALARNVLGDILRRDNSCVEAIRWMGWCFKQEGDLNNAAKCYEQLTQLRVTDQDLFELGEIYYSLKRDADAQAVWLDALGQCDAESPRLFDLHKNLGNVFTRMADYDGAEENYNKALVIRPMSDVVQVNLGSLNFQRGKYKEALEFFKRAVEINPYSDRGWCGVALVAREMKDEEWAWGVLHKSLDLNPYNVTSLYVAANWAQQDCRWDDAVSRLQIYVDKFQDDADMLYSLAGLLFQKGDLLGAELELTRLEALDPARLDIEELRQLILSKANGLTSTGH